MEVQKMGKLKVRDKSTVEPPENIMMHVVWAILIFFNYNNLIFISMGRLTVMQSKLILFGLIVLFSVIGIAIRWRRCASFRSSFLDPIIGAGIYTILAYKEYYKYWTLAISIICLLIVAISFGFYFVKKIKGRYIFKIKNADKRMFVIKNRLAKAADVSSMCISGVMLLLIVPIAFNQIVNEGIIATKYNAINTVDSEDYFAELDIKDNLDTIEKIRCNERWKPLTIKERLEVCQAVVDCERAYWGIKAPVTVVLAELDDNIISDYCDEGTCGQKIIHIDKRSLESDDADVVLGSICHEMYHCFQYRLIEAYSNASEDEKLLRIYRHCDEYIDELANYQEASSSYEEFTKYYTQYLEYDSRVYAESAVLDYYYQIDYYQDNLEKFEGKILD